MATVRRARRQRRAMSLPEVLVWQHLRTRPGGFRFRRQHPLGDLVLDFACLETRLCVEIDGEHHNRGDQPAYDMRRDTVVEHAGFITLRIPATDVFRDLDSTVVAIVAACRRRVPLHPDAMRRGPPPRTGEE